MKRSTEIKFWLALAVAGAIIQRQTDIPLIVLMLAAFSVAWLLETWENHKFNQKLAQMAREVRERGNA